MSTARPAAAPVHSLARRGVKGRSGVSNGSRLHVERIPVGSMTAWGRRFRDVLSEICADLSPDGPEHLSEGQRQLARRAALLSIECERMEGSVARGEAVNVELYGVTADRVARTFARLGIKRAAKPAPTVEEYLASKRGAS
jgi:hypothetical protein